MDFISLFSWWYYFFAGSNTKIYTYIDGFTILLTSLKQTDVAKSEVSTANNFYGIV